MAKKSKERRSLENLNTPSQEDEADILAEAGAEPDENGELVIDEETALKLGAVDVESIRENRRLEQVAAKKKANIVGVSFNTDDPIDIFDTISKSWGPNSFHINVKRLTGTPVQDVITSLPRSGMELLAALKDFHAQKGDPHAEATYEVKFRDAGNKQIRGTGRITIPAVRPQPGQGPMNAPQYPYSAPPYYAPPQPPAVAQYPQGAPPQPAPAAPQQPPSVNVMPQPGPDPMAMMQQMFGMFRQMQESFAAQTQPQPQQPQMPPPPPQNADPSAMMGWMQQFFQMFQQMQAQHQPPPSRRGEPAQQPQQPQMNPMMGMMGSMMPPVQTPPGMMWIPGLGFAPIDRVAQLFSAPSPGSRPAHRPPYYPQGEGGPSQYGPGPGPGQPYQPPPPPPAQRQLTPAEQFREAISVVRTAVSAVEEFRDLVPQAGEHYEAPSAPNEDDDSPVRVMDTGKGKILFDKKEGSIRGWETFWANVPEMLKWGGEQVEVIRKSHVEQQRAQQQPTAPQQLPAGYVEVTPGYQPPPGYIAVPVEAPPQGGLPPPPANMPPPIQSTPAPRRTWEAPVMPPTEGEGY